MTAEIKSAQVGEWIWAGYEHYYCIVAAGSKDIATLNADAIAAGLWQASFKMINGSPRRGADSTIYGSLAEAKDAASLLLGSVITPLQPNGWCKNPEHGMFDHRKTNECADFESEDELTADLARDAEAEGRARAAAGLPADGGVSARYVVEYRPY